MEMRLWKKCMYCVFSVLLGPAILLAATSPCQTGKPTPESYKYNFPNEATNLLNREGTDALRVRSDANQLTMYTRDNVTWQIYADMLTRMKSRVDKMDNMICRLNSIKRVASPWQRRMITRVRPQVVVLTDEVNDAIHFVNNNQNYLWSPTFVNYTKDMYATSKQVSKDLRSVEEYASLHKLTTPMTASTSLKANS